MSIPLAEALQQVELETGKTYRCEIGEQLVEVRVLARRSGASAPIEPDVMLDAWVELPEPPGGEIVRTRPGEVQLPDVLELR